MSAKSVKYQNAKKKRLTDKIYSAVRKEYAYTLVEDDELRTKIKKMIDRAYPTYDEDDEN